MKKLIFLNIVFLSLMGRTSDLCSPLNGLQDNLNDVQNVNCEQINKEGQCKEAPPVDENALRTRITSLLNVSEDPKKIEAAKRGWGSFASQNPWAVKMYAEMSQYEIQEKMPPTPIMDWMSDKNFSDKAKSKAEYREAFIKKYVDFAKKMDCTPTFKASDNYIEPHPTIKGFSAERMGREEKDARLRALNDELKDPKNIQAVQERMSKISEQSTDRFYICNERPDLQARYRVAERFQPCAGNFKKNFSNNKSDISQTDLSKLLATPEAEELSKCIKDHIAKGGKLHHVSIVSSASSLNNTGDAEKRFCKKGFLGLSTDRANTAKNIILPGLFDKAGAGGTDLSKVDVKIDASGANGDGTSGPCVYEMKNGKEVIKPQYATKEGQAELDENRYVKIQVTFEEAGKKLDDKVPFYQPMYRCKKIEFKCE